MPVDHELIEVVGLGHVEWFEREVVEDEQLDAGQLVEGTAHRCGARDRLDKLAGWREYMRPTEDPRRPTVCASTGINCARTSPQTTGLGRRSQAG